MLIWIGGWALIIPVWATIPVGVIMLGLSVGGANYFLEKSTEHDNDIDYLRNKKLEDLLNEKV